MLCLVRTPPCCASPAAPGFLRRPCAVSLADRPAVDQIRRPPSPAATTRCVCHTAEAIAAGLSITTGKIPLGADACSRCTVSYLPAAPATTGTTVKATVKITLKGPAPHACLVDIVAAIVD